MKKEKQTLDPVGYSFQLLENMGHEIDINFVAFTPNGLEVLPLKHSHFDGVSGYIKILRDKKQLQENSFPPAPQRGPPTGLERWIKQTRAYIKLIFQRKKAPQKWTTALSPAMSASMTFSLFGEQETRDVQRKARQHRVTINTYLLHHLNQIISTYIEGSAPSDWSIPVALYPEFHADIQAQNQSSIIVISMEHSDSMRTTQQKIRQEITGESYLGAVLATKMISALSPSFASRLVQFSLSRVPLTGIFSNLGYWRGREDANILGYSGVPPVFPFQPLSAGIIVYNGRLGAGIRAHAQLGFNNKQLEKVLESWKSRLLS